MKTIYKKIISDNLIDIRRIVHLMNPKNILAIHADFCNDKPEKFENYLENLKKIK